jgi:hypothetical protein
VGAAPRKSGGQALVRVLLADASGTALAYLRRLGFQVTRQDGSLVTGRISLEKLEVLSRMNQLLRIEPAR